MRMLILLSSLLSTSAFAANPLIDCAKASFDYETFAITDASQVNALVPKDTQIMNTRTDMFIVRPGDAGITWLPLSKGSACMNGSAAAAKLTESLTLPWTGYLKNLQAGTIDPVAFAKAIAACRGLGAPAFQRLIIDAETLFKQKYPSITIEASAKPRTQGIRD